MTIQTFEALQDDRRRHVQRVPATTSTTSIDRIVDMLNGAAGASLDFVSVVNPFDG